MRLVMLAIVCLAGAGIFVSCGDDLQDTKDPPGDLPPRSGPPPLQGDGGAG